jgi:hypothetical protein
MLAKTSVRLADTYRRTAPRGTNSLSSPFASDRLWNEDTRFASAEVERGVSGEDLLTIAGRSAEFDAANKLLHSGAQLKDTKFTATVFRWSISGPDFDL